jgi:hypothetical protein
MASTWSQGQWNLGTWNNAVSGASVVGIQANGSTGSFSFDLGNGAVFVTTGVSAAIDINLGNGWSREEWNTGAWNQPIGSIVAGSGTVFVEDGQELTSSVNNVTTVASAQTSVTGEQLNISLGDETVIGTADVAVTLAGLSISVGTLALTGTSVVSLTGVNATGSTGEEQVYSLIKPTQVANWIEKAA